MDIESRFENGEQVRAAGPLDEAEWERRREKVLREMATNRSEEPRTVALQRADVEAQAEGQPLAVLAAGAVIGPAERRVRLLRNLGNHGRVWLALSVTPDTERALSGEEHNFLAIKLFSPPGAASIPRDTGRDERSQRAGMIGWRAYLTKVRSRIEQAMKLDHPNIAHVYGWWVGSDGWPFAEMEYIDRRDGYGLVTLLREQGANGLLWEIVLQWLKPVALALDYARQNYRLAHNNLDADAIYMTGQGVIKVLGFGLVSEIVAPPSLFATGASDPVTGAQFDVSAGPFSAEIAFRRDVFALALLVYHMLTGRSAYDAKNQLGEEEVSRPPGLTGEAWRILRRGLSYPSDLCPTDAGQFIKALEEAQQAVAEPAARKARPPVWVLAGAAALLLLIGSGIYGFFQEDGQEAVQFQPPPARAGLAPEGGAKLPEQGQTASSEVSLEAAESEADLRAFESAKRMDTAGAYQLYLQRCPRCGFEREARMAINNLRTGEKINTLKGDFETLARGFEQENRADQGEKALDRLNALAELAPNELFITAGRRRLALGWVALARVSADKGDLAEAWRALRKAELIQPRLPELAVLTATLKQAEVTDRIRQADKDAFAVAQRTHTRKAYWVYLDRCAEGCQYRAEAEAALARLNATHRMLQERLSDGSAGPELVVIPAGRFEMGSPPNENGRYEDEPRRLVRIARPFAIGKYEVTFAEYDRFAKATNRSLPTDQGWGRDQRPVINVSWQDAQAFTDWLSEQTGRRYRLPTEAEWEYAARADTTSSRYWGNDPDQGCAYANAADQDGKRVFVGWTEMRCRDGYVYTAPVGSYRSNDYNLHDMLGNVLEWTCSLYSPESQAPSQSCDQPQGDRQFVVRGGSWNDEPRSVRAADRHRNQPTFSDYFLGFRVVRELP